MERKITDITAIRPNSWRTDVSTELVDGVHRFRNEFPHQAAGVRSWVDHTIINNIYRLTTADHVYLEERLAPLRDRLKDRRKDPVVLVLYHNHTMGGDVMIMALIENIINPDTETAAIYFAAYHHNDAEHSFVEASFANGVGALYGTETQILITEKGEEELAKKRGKPVNTRIVGEYNSYAFSQARKKIDEEMAKGRNAILLLAPEGERNPALGPSAAAKFARLSQHYDCIFQPVAIIPEAWRPFGVDLPFGLGQPGEFINAGHHANIIIGDFVETTPSHPISADTLMRDHLAPLLPPHMQGYYAPSAIAARRAVVSARS